MSVHPEELHQVMAYEEQYQTYFQRIRFCVASTGVLCWPLPESKLKKALVITYSVISLVILISYPVYVFSNLSQDTKDDSQLYTIAIVGPGMGSISYILLWFAYVYLQKCIKDTVPIFSAFEKSESALEVCKFHVRFTVFQVVSALVALIMTAACILIYHFNSYLVDTSAFIVFDICHTLVSKYQKFMSCAIVISLSLLLHHELHVIAVHLEGKAGDIEILVRKTRKRFLKLTEISNRLDCAVSCILAIQVSSFILTLCTALLLTVHGLYSSNQALYPMFIITGTIPVICFCITIVNKASLSFLTHHLHQLFDCVKFILNHSIRPKINKWCLSDIMMMHHTY